MHVHPHILLSQLRSLYSHSRQCMIHISASLPCSSSLSSSLPVSDLCLRHLEYSRGFSSQLSACERVFHGRHMDCLSYLCTACPLSLSLTPSLTHSLAVQTRVLPRQDINPKNKQSVSALQLLLLLTCPTHGLGASLEWQLALPFRFSHAQ